MPTVPTSVTFDDFQAAIKPLLDLCGVKPNQILSDIHITSSHISLLVVVPAAGHEDDDDPPALRLPRAPQEFTYPVYPVTIGVSTLLPHECDGCEACERHPITEWVDQHANGETVMQPADLGGGNHA